MLARRLALIVIALIALAPAAQAQPLADRVPGDAIFYAGWAGTEKLGDGYAMSHLKAVLDASAFPQLATQLPVKLVEHLSALPHGPLNDPIAQEWAKVLAGLGESFIKHPTALYVGPVNLAERLPIPRLAIFCEAGKDAQGLSDQIAGVIKKMPADAPVKLYLQVWPGDLLVLSTFDIGARIEESLAQRDPFKAAMKQSVPQPAMVAYFDAEKVINVASLVMAMAGDDRTKTLYRQVLATTGLAGVKRLLFTAGFDQKDWATHFYAEAPVPRSGLLANLLGTQPVSDELLKWAPQSTTWLAATRLDLAETLRVTRVATGRIVPETGAEFESSLNQLNAVLGMDLQKDLLAALGDQWLVYNSEQTGPGLAGMCLVNPLRDKAKVEAAFAKIEKLASDALAKGPQAAGVTAELRVEQLGGLTIHRLPMPAFDPCWTIKGNTLYVALYPQVLLAAAGHDGSAEKSVLARESFTAARKRLGAPSSASLMYADLPALAPRGYPLMMALCQGATGFMDLVGLETPGMVLPPLTRITPELNASVGGTWVDSAGWHYRCLTPFPGANLLAGEQGLITATPLAMGLAMPAMAKARQNARAVQDMSNLRQISVGIMMYANENKGVLPPDLASLTPYLNGPRAFISAKRSAAIALPPNDAKPQELADWINKNADVIYQVPAGSKLSAIKQPAEYMLAWEKPDPAAGPLISVLFADGHVTRMLFTDFQQQLAAQKNAIKQP